VRRPSPTRVRRSRARVIGARDGVRAPLKSVAPQMNADGAAVPTLRSLANRRTRIIGAIDGSAQGAAANENAARPRAAPHPTSPAAPLADQPSRQVRFARLDMVAAALAIVPLFGAAALLIAKPEGWTIALSERPAVEHIQKREQVTFAPPTAKAATPFDRPQLLEGMRVEPLKIVDGPVLEILPTDPPSYLIPAIVAESEDFAGRERRCELDDASLMLSATKFETVLRSDGAAADIGLLLAEAAIAQTSEFVVYTDSYRRLKYPHGDVSALFGVCTDVIIRAYRAVGVDLQSLVHRSGVGRGDPSIDHRRTEVLRRFFAANGQSLPPSDVAEDYAPGDIVSYHRPQNNGSQSHIAIVSDVIGVSGRPLIVHNRGWGPQLEDALFVDRITGHYRYSGQSTALAQSRPVSGPRRLSKSQFNRRAATRAAKQGAVASDSSAARDSPP
jgi:uncharacterized protein YijF (DUF1287 family)